MIVMPGIIKINVAPWAQKFNRLGRPGGPFCQNSSPPLSFLHDTVLMRTKGGAYWLADLQLLHVVVLDPWLGSLSKGSKTCNSLRPLQRNFQDLSRTNSSNSTTQYYHKTDKTVIYWPSVHKNHACYTISLCELPVFEEITSFLSCSGNCRQDGKHFSWAHKQNRKNT